MINFISSIYKRLSYYLYINQLKKYNRHIDRALIKYHFIILYIFNKEEIIYKSLIFNKEQFYINLFNPYDNMALIAGGIKTSDSTKLKFSKSLLDKNKGKVHTESTKILMGIQNIGNNYKAKQCYILDLNNNIIYKFLFFLF